MSLKGSGRRDCHTRAPDGTSHKNEPVICGQ